MQTMRIGEVARRTGVSTMTIRYYEVIGVMPRPPRASNGYRDYQTDAIERLSFVRDAQKTGLTLAESPPSWSYAATASPPASMSSSCCSGILRRLSAVSRRCEPAVTPTQRSSSAPRPLNQATAPIPIVARPSPGRHSMRLVSRWMRPAAGGPASGHMPEPIGAQRARRTANGSGPRLVRDDGSSEGCRVRGSATRMRQG